MDELIKDTGSEAMTSTADRLIHEIVSVKKSMMRICQSIVQYCRMKHNEFPQGSRRRNNVSSGGQTIRVQNAMFNPSQTKQR